MGNFIDNLKEWFDSLSDDELVKSWEKSTEGMSDNSHYIDFISESEVKFQNEDDTEEIEPCCSSPK